MPRAEGAAPAVVGTRRPRVDAGAFARGAARYATDMAVPGMLHCRLLYAPQAPARITRVDTAAAARLPGVRAIVTAAEAPPMPPTGMSIAARQLFARDEVRTVADVLAAVAADDDETARRAVELIEVGYEERPGAYTLDAAWDAGSPAVHPGKAGYRNAPWLNRFMVAEPGNVATHFHLRKGDTAAARGRAHVVVAGRFQTQRMEHFSMEPHAAIVDYDPATRRVTLWASTGKPFRTIIQMGELLRLPMNRVSASYVPTGGDFGGKGEVTIEPYCAVLSMKTGRPVKGVYSREEEFFAATCKTPFDIRLTLGTDREGLLLFTEGDLRLDTGAYNSMSAMVAAYAAMLLEGPYAVPNVAVDARCVFTHNVMSGSFRGFGSPQVAFAREALLDEAAARLGLDPVELRLRNAWRAGAVTVTGQVLHAARHSVTVRDTITAAADAIGWATRRAEPAGVSDKVVGRLSADRTLGQPGPADAGPPAGAFGRTRRGIGLATAHHGLGGPAVIGTDTATAFVKANPDGTVTLLTGAADVGQGIDTALSQIVGEELRIPADAISIAVKVTDGVPDDQGASASRTLYSVGNATRTAAVNLRDKLLALAAEMLEADRQDLEWGEGTIAVRGTPARTLTMTEVVRQSMLRRGEQPIGLGVHHGHGVALDEQGHGELQSFEYSTQAAEVEVDLDTGEVRVLRLVNAQEVGRAINPLIVEGQVEGGMVMGLGFALLEEVVCRDGQVLNPYAFDYRVPRAEDMPEITTVLLEHRDPVGPYGAKGCGEICMDPTAAAIANAVSNAIGARVTSLPITPEKVLRAIREAAEARAREAQAPR